MDYFITAKEEVLREVASSIIAKIIRYMIDNDIKIDHKNPMSILLDAVDDLSDSLIENPDYSMEDLEKISAKLNFARDYINEVAKANV
ncbi:MAG: hypothetical protein K2G25_06015 [Oscillospiraceae bacterium]|nr:hypothetical protein [Oscillospiraceae bacterium]